MSIPGFVPKPRTVEVACAWFEPAEGAEPLRATLRADLTFKQIEGLGALLTDKGVTYGQLWPAVAPFVLGWNAVALDLATGEYAPVPPPAEAGRDALRAVDPLVTTWLLVELTRVHLGGEERQGKSPPSDGTSAPSDGDSTTSPPPTGTTTTSRSRRKGSAESSPTT